MATSDNAEHPMPIDQTQFHHAFSQLASAILEEWPELEAEALSATNGKFDTVVALIMEKTGHTKAVTRRQIEEIFRIVTSPADARNPKRGEAAFAHEARAVVENVSEAAREALNATVALLAQFEKRSAHVLRELRGNVLTPTRDKIRQHWILSLAIALGLGFILGILFNGMTRRGK